MSDNKRRAERFAINEEFAALADEGSVTFVSDLSQHGLFLHTRHRIEIGRRIELRFTLVLDDPVVISAEGRVVRHADDGMGVEFTSLAPDMVLRIHDAISRQRAAQEDSNATAQLPRVEAQAVTARAAKEQDNFDNARTGVYTVPEVDPEDLVDDDDEDEPVESRPGHGEES